MSSTTTTPIAARIPNEHAAAFRRQAARYGLTPSKAIATLVAGALAIEADQEHTGQRPGERPRAAAE